MLIRHRRQDHVLDGTSCLHGETAGADGDGDVPLL